MNDESVEDRIAWLDGAVAVHMAVETTRRCVSPSSLATYVEYIEVKVRLAHMTPLGDETFLYLPLMEYTIAAEDAITLYYLDKQEAAIRFNDGPVMRIRHECWPNMLIWAE